MPDIAQERAHLADAEDHIADGKRLIERLERLMERLQAQNGDTAIAERSLATMREALALFEEQRELILRTIDDIESGKYGTKKSPR